MTDLDDWLLWRRAVVTDLDDWLLWRRDGIGGSDIAAVLGISPWRGAWTVWATKTVLIPEESPTEAMEYGKRVEPMLARWFTDRTGLYVVGEQTMCRHPDRPWMRCTVDGFVAEDETADELAGIAEWKTDSGAPWTEIPAHYQAQGQWNMAVTGLDRCWFGVLHGRRFRVYVLERNQDDIDLMVDEAEAFWTGHVLTGKPPTATAADLETVRRAWPDREPESSTDLARTLYYAWLDAKVTVTNAEQEYDRMTSQLLAALGDHEVGMVDGEPVLTHRSQTRRRLDEEAMRADGINLDKYRVPGEPYRVLRPVRRKP